MSRNPSFAVVLKGGRVQATIVQDWPRHMPLPQFVIVDYDTEDAAADEVTHFAIGPSMEEAICRGEAPTAYESLPNALSPRVVLAALGESVRDNDAESPLAMAESVRQSILELDGHINASEQAPTGDDYNTLYVLANCGLIDILKALGDTTDFGE
ncbi:MAG: hypothetical protein ACTIJQ_01010 [Alcaligenes sp.]